MNGIGFRAEQTLRTDGLYQKNANKPADKIDQKVLSDYFIGDTFTPQKTAEPEHSQPKRTKLDAFISISGLVLTLVLTAVMAFNLKPMITPYLKRQANNLFKDYKNDPNIYLLDELPGMEKAKEIFYQKVIYPSKYKTLYQQEQVDPSAYILLWGDPGVGKTNFVYSAAKQVGAKVATIKLSEEGSSYVNGTAIQIHEKAKAIISHAKKNPNQEYFVLIDEIEAILEETHKMGDEKLKDIKTMLQTLDMFKPYKNIRIFATTNSSLNTYTGRVGNMNSAATNRFSTKIFIDKPDQKAIKQALNLWLKKHPSAKEFLANESAVKDIAKDLVGYGYRDLQNIKDLALEKMMNLKLNALNTHQDTHQIKLTPELIREALSEYARTSFNNKGAKKTA